MRCAAQRSGVSGREQGQVPARARDAGTARRGSRLRALAAGLGLLGALASLPTRSAQAETITVTGSSTIAPLMSEIGKRFEASHPSVRVDVQTGGSSRGVSDARQGLAQIGMASRDKKDDERDLNWIPIARDGIAIILHAENPVAKLSSDQIRGIYRGQIQKWSEVGGKDAEITVVNKAEGRSTLELFVAHFKLDVKEIAADVVIGDNLQGIKTVAGNPDAIAYVSVGTAEYEIEAGTPIKMFGPDGSSASIAEIRAGRYPVQRPLHLVTKGTPTGAVAELVSFAQSKEVQDLVKEQYFVSLGE
jgi:phosphate transport system substrate-binding protein